MVESLDKAAFFRLIGYGVKAQPVADFHNSTARTRIAHAPARTSKSYAAYAEGTFHAIPSWEIVDGRHCFIREPTGDRLIWVIGPNYDTIKEWDYIYDTLVVSRRRNGLGKLYKVRSKTNAPKQGNMRIVLEFPADRHGHPVNVIIQGKSASNPESLQGEQVYLAIMSEAAEHSADILAKYLGPRCTYTILPTTPKLSAEWLRELIDLGLENPALSIESFQFTPHANPKYDWDLYWIEHQKAESRVHGSVRSAVRSHDCFANLADCPASLDPWFAEQFQGLWTGADERLLPFSDVHVIHELPAWCKDARHFVSCDYGYADAAVALFWAVGERESYVLLGEIYETQKTATAFVNAIHAKAKVLGCRPDYFVGDPKQPQIAQLMRERGLPVWDVNKKAMADRAAGYHAMVDALSTDPVLGHPRLRLLSERVGEPFGCPKTINEWRRLRRKKETASKEWADGAVVGEDHAADACRYGIQTRPKPKHLQPANAIRDYIAQLGRRRPLAAAQSAGRLVGGAPRMNAEVA